MARITATELKEAIAAVNERMKGAGSQHAYEYAARNGYHAVEVYLHNRNLYTAGIGTAKECIGKLYSDAFDRIADAYCDRLREAAGEFTTTGPKFYPGARVPIPSDEFITASINLCAGIPMDALTNFDPQKVHDLVMEDYQPQG